MTINTNTYLDNRPEGIETWIEPESQLRYSKHPHNKVIAQTPSGSSFHMDSTPEYEHIRLQHRSGSYTEVQNDGTEVHKIVGDGYEIITRNKNVLIKGYCNITIEGDCTMHVKGDYVQRIDGDFFQEVRGDSTTYVAGDCSVNSQGDMELSVGGLLSEITLSSSEGVQIQGDLDVTGAIATKSTIHADLNITTSKYVTGDMGLATMGGILIGSVPSASITAPLPGEIQGLAKLKVPLIESVIIKNTGAIFSTDIEAAYVIGGMVCDGVGSLGSLRNQYNAHVHPNGNNGALTYQTTHPA
jgi:hypothetical protein